MKKLYSPVLTSPVLTDVFTAIGIISVFYTLMAVIVLLAW